MRKFTGSVTCFIVARGRKHCACLTALLRQPFGATHLWYEIGTANEGLRNRGSSYDERMDKLGVRFMLARTQVETAIAKYERAMDETRTITAGISGR